MNVEFGYYTSKSYISMTIVKGSKQLKSCKNHFRKTKYH